MSGSDELEQLRKEVAAWREAYGSLPIRRDVEFTTVSGREV
jgi:hypothetical protein